MTKEEAYLKLAKKYFTKKYYHLENLDFVCIDVKRLLFGKGCSKDLITIKNFPELFLFRKSNRKKTGAWMTGDFISSQEIMEIKG